MILRSETNQYMGVVITPELLIESIALGTFRENGVVWMMDNNLLIDMVHHLIEIYKEDPVLYRYIWQMCKDTQEGLMSPEEIKIHIRGQQIRHLDSEIEKVKAVVDDLIFERDKLMKGMVEIK